jgi:uncharacterized DUF497 family protein
MDDIASFRDWQGFDWDEGNLLKNWEKHRVSASECEQVFFNHPLVAGPDEKHSGSEMRHYALGVTDAGRRLFLVFTVRRKRIRVICARDMNRKERKVFDEIQ